MSQPAVNSGQRACSCCLSFLHRLLRGMCSTTHHCWVGSTYLQPTGIYIYLLGGIIMLVVTVYACTVCLYPPPSPHPPPPTPHPPPPSLTPMSDATHSVTQLHLLLENRPPSPSEYLRKMCSSCTADPLPDVELRVASFGEAFLRCSPQVGCGWCVRVDVHGYMCSSMFMCGYGVCCKCLRIHAYRKLSYVQYPVVVLLYTTP